MPTHSSNPPIAPVAPADAAVWLELADRHWSAWTVTPEQLADHLGHHANDVGDCGGWSRAISRGNRAIRADGPQMGAGHAMPAGNAAPA